LPVCVQYTPTPEGGVDWRHRVLVVCPCGYGYAIVAADVQAIQPADFDAH
jgi:hypothetical protein